MYRPHALINLLPEQSSWYLTITILNRACLYQTGIIRQFTHTLCDVITTYHITPCSSVLSIVQSYWNVNTQHIVLANAIWIETARDYLFIITWSKRCISEEFVIIMLRFHLHMFVWFSIRDAIACNYLCSVLYVLQLPLQCIHLFTFGRDNLIT